MDVIYKAYENAVQLFGSENVSISSSTSPPIDIVVRVNSVSGDHSTYAHSYITLSYDGKYYWMTIDDFKWEFDNNVAKFLSTSNMYMDAIKNDLVYITGHKIGKFRFFQSLEIRPTSKQKNLNQANEHD